MCALYVRCALSVLQKERRKVWGARYTLGARYRSENTVINYGIIIKSISTLMWHVDKYKITFKLVINHWSNEMLVTDICYTDVIYAFWV